MARSPTFKLFLRLLGSYSSTTLNDKHITTNRSRRRFVAGAAACCATANPLAQALAHADDGIKNNKSPRIAIVGGGIAGLNAAYQLNKAGVHAQVYEASRRLGGRILTRPNVVGDSLLTEVGAEFINVDHVDMLDLANDFGLELFNRKDDSARLGFPSSAYYFGGRTWPEHELADLLRPLAHQINNDATLLDEDWDSFAPQFDQLSVKEYLAQHASLINAQVIRDLIENSIRTEFGVEPAESSALQLLFNLPVVEANTVEVLGNSDETFVVKQGNSRIIDGLASTLHDRIHTGMALSKLAQNNKGQFRLTFANGKRKRADFVILAVPFNVLRNIELEVTLPDSMRKFIKDVDLGHNEKVVAGFNERSWHQDNGFSADGWADLGFSAFWDSSQRQDELTNGSLTYYLGAKDLDTKYESADEQAHAFTAAMNAFIPGLEGAANNKTLRTRWSRNRWSRGAYSSFRPGQLTEFADHFWIEADNPDEAQEVRFGNLLFAGEQVSDAYYGFMNGGAQTGRLAAQSLLELLSFL